MQKLTGERDALQGELEELKRKFEGVRSRNKVLSSEVKTLRGQMGTLVEKGRHDDELIDALMVGSPSAVLNPGWAQPETVWSPRALCNLGAQSLHPGTGQLGFRSTNPGPEDLRAEGKIEGRGEMGQGLGSS